MQEEPLTELDLSVTDKLLSTTRSVRKRLDLTRPVPPEVVLECLRLAVQAPTGSNSQGWRWLIVTDADKKRELARMYNDSGRAYLESASGAEMDPQTERVYESALFLADVLADVPVHVIPCLKGRPDNQPNPAGFFGSILPATWSFMLALRSRGLGATWTTLHLGRERQAAELLGVPFESYTQVALLPVAYTVGTDFKPAARPPVENITYWNSWGNTR